MSCEKCGYQMDFGRRFSFYGGKDLGDHSYSVHNGNVIITYKVQGRQVDERLNILLCNHCLIKVQFLKTSDWVLGSGVILVLFILLPLFDTIFPAWASYWVILISSLPMIVVWSFLAIRWMVDSKRVLNLNDLELEKEIKIRKKSSFWVGAAYHLAINTKFAKTKTKVTLLNGQGWVIDDKTKHFGCKFAYVYLSEPEYNAFMAKIKKD